MTIDSTSTAGTILRLSNGSPGGHVFDLLSTGSGNTGGAGRLDIFDKTVGLARLSIAASGNVGVGTTSPTHPLDVLGLIYADKKGPSETMIPGSGILGVNSGDLGGASGNRYAELTHYTSGTQLRTGGYRSGMFEFWLGDGPDDATSGPPILSVRSNKQPSGQGSGSGTGATLQIRNGGDTAYIGLDFVSIPSLTVGDNVPINTNLRFQNQSFGGNTYFENTNDAGVRSETVRIYKDGGLNIANAQLYMSNALFLSRPGSNNVLMGLNAGSTSVSGSGETAIGASSLHAITSGSNNTAIGALALNGDTTGQNNTGIGYNSLSANVDGSRNVALGQGALKDTVSAWYNIGIGDGSGTGNTSGQRNIYIGATAGASGDGLNQSVALGYGALVTASNQIVLGTATEKAYLPGIMGIATTSPWRKLSVTGTVGFDGLTGATGAGSLCLSANKEVVYNSGSDNCLSSLRSTKHDITDLTISGTSTVAALRSVSFIYNDDASSTVRYGFIAEDTAAVDPHFATYDAQGKVSGVDDRSLISILVKAVQEMIDELAALESTVAGLARSFTSKQITATQQLCVEKSDGTPVCVTGDQLATVLAGATPAPAQVGEPAPPIVSGTSTPDTDAPVITVLGNNPAAVDIGATYNDLGATVTDNVDINLGIHAFVGTTPIEQAVIDTSAPATYHINYVATDAAGNTATSTRTVVVQAATSSPSP